MANPDHAFHAMWASGGGDYSHLLVAESNHRIANSLTLTAAMLRMQRAQSADPDVRQAIFDAEMRITSVAAIHTYLHRHDSTDRIDLADFLYDALPQIGAAIGVRCILRTNLPGPMIVSGGIATQIMIIVNELALNAVKHGYAGAGGGTVVIELGRSADDKLKLTFADGGTGLPDGFDPAASDGLGFRIVTSLVDGLGGSLSCHNDGGALFTILIPTG